MFHSAQCHDASKLQSGQAQYSGLLTPQGTFVDDLLVYRLKSDHFLLVVNAANIVKDYTWIAEDITNRANAGDAVVAWAEYRDPQYRPRSAVRRSPAP